VRIARVPPAISQSAVEAFVIDGGKFSKKTARKTG
jgi:hypothetical protein